MRAAIALLVALSIDGCGSHEPVSDKVGKLPASFVETVPGTNVTFTMRPVATTIDEKRQRIVWFAETETTWDAYDAFYLRHDDEPVGVDAITRPTLPYAPPDRGWGHSGFPVIGVTFQAATAYCRWLSEKTGRRYRLPTDQEWRDATWNHYWSFGVASPEDLAWLADNSPEQATHPVGKLQPNQLGLYDMIGNVAEWCSVDGAKPVVLGGSFETNLPQLADEEVDSVLFRGEPQSLAWNASDPSFPRSKWWLRDAPFVGFRVVCEEAPK